ncbi:MAG: lysylphosphatidylglycerol synthase transmembrane domain-containing protein [Roseinatronobacter sp.]
MKIALRLGLSLGVLGFALWLAAPAEVGQALSRLQPGWLALAVAALSAQIALSALRWRVTVRALGHGLDHSKALREYGLSVAANTFLPGGVLGDAGRIARSRAYGWRDAAAAVLVERLAGQVALGGLAAGAAMLWLGPVRGALLVVALGTLAAGALAFLPGLRHVLARAWGGPWRAQLGLSLAIVTVNLVGYWTAAQAVGVTLDASQTLRLIPLTLLAMLLPITINGWGLREGVAATLWPLAGVAAAQAVAASVAFGLACMGAALIGLLPWLARDRTQQPH